MSPLLRVTVVLSTVEEFVAAQRKMNVSASLAALRYAEHKKAELWVNERYIVTLYRNYRGEMNVIGVARTMFSVRRVDGQPLGDWNDIQKIKNQLLGREMEMVQLFPAESRKVDMVNQYWFYDNGGRPFRFGVKNREVA